jgi:predicted GNAT family acetyltransferase
MLILFDHGTPRGLARQLSEHQVKTAREMGWDCLTNGELLRSAEEAGFHLLLTTDQNLRYQQNLSGRAIAIIVLCGTTKWLRVREFVPRIAAALDVCQPGSYTEVHIPLAADEKPSPQ